MILILLCGVINGVCAETNAPLTATDIVRQSDDLLRGLESYAKMEMVVTRPRWTRSVRMEGWTRGTDQTFIRILAPRKEKGVTFLKNGREAWQYVPAVDKVIKLPPSMMLQSWMGSDFTNDDVVRADSIVVDYTHRIIEEPVEDGVAYWVIDAVPKEGAPVVWGRIRMKIQKDGIVPAKAEYFDEDDELVKYYETSAIKEIEGRKVATKFTMQDMLEEGNSTSIEYLELTFRPEIKAGTFSVRNLRR